MRMIQKILSSILFFIIFIYITSFICSVPVNYNIENINGKLTPNYKFSDLAKLTHAKVMYLINPTDINLQEASISDSKEISGKAYHEKMVSFLLKAFTKSGFLLFGSLLLAMIVGILKGIFDSRRGTSRDSNFKVLLTIIPISIPDILIVAILQAFAIFLIHHGIKIFKVAGSGTINHVLLPIIALSILPACYIARVTVISIENCYSSNYIKTAIGKGCSKGRILWNHVMRNALSLIIESLPSITALIISNMVIVEYMFSYPGLITRLFNYFAEGNSLGVMLSVIFISIYYFIMEGIFKMIKMVFVRMEDSI